MNWKDIANYFNNYEIINEGNLKEIINNKVTRTGLEFADFFVHHDLKSVVLWGKDEYLYLKQFTLDLVAIKLEKIFQLTPPIIILSRSFGPTNILLDLAKKYHVTIMKTNESSSSLTNWINTFLTEKLTKRITIHGNLMEMYGEGVLITGHSGLGKSEISIELIRNGHMFVADDVIECYNLYNKIIGKAPDEFYGFLEARGLGIINAERMFGIKSVKKSTQITVKIEIVQYDNKIHELERLGKELQYQQILGVNIPYFLVPITPGKKTSEMIEVIVAHLKLLLAGYNSFQALDAKLKERFIK